MKLPRAAQARIDLKKLTDYCLNPDHPRGKHKARVFEEVLGLKRADAAELEMVIRERILREDCESGLSDVFGDRYNVDFNWERLGRTARVRTSWIVRHADGFPRLTTCYLL